ncbi:hypothetical protein K461DRAFT_286648 [Myriangium duriaei CBS 260.36]|uniref:Splicing factor Cactin n=1 Tax=Myriangium duriaei CBS 260.36 TaxID=1168546 RepID=A0A9P4IXD0_9PEZI|nr:hypothetical protein K461DRAFT_286648 [Myriangium duriaei CBS 260.36]
MSHNPKKRPAETQEEAWVADEDRFVLQQAKKKAALRIKSGRSRPIDLLAVALRTIDPSRNGFDDDDGDDDSLVVNPEAVFEGLGSTQLEELEKEIDTYLALEKNRSNYEYWQTMKVVCKDRRRESQSTHAGKSISSVAKDLDKILGPKTLKELESLEKQIKQKLRSNEPIDVDYWESLLKRLSVHKARALLRKVSQDVMGARTKELFREQEEAAARLSQDIMQKITAAGDSPAKINVANLDPESSLRIAPSDKMLPIIDCRQFEDNIRRDWDRVKKAGFVAGRSANATSGAKGSSKSQDVGSGSAAYEREVARGMGENEEVFAAEEVEAMTRRPPWADQYEPRKPRYFNRVQMGFEWNKYNQTHYDQDNPPPKVVQGYRFNIFYPDLIDNTKAPTYRIERENGRRKGQTFAPAGEDDTCVIRFIAGAPYQDLAFRIVDREWDYSAKRDRGFKSSFDKGILQLHFQFKKIFYRK